MRNQNIAIDNNKTSMAAKLTHIHVTHLRAHKAT